MSTTTDNEVMNNTEEVKNFNPFLATRIKFEKIEREQEQEEKVSVVAVADAVADENEEQQQPLFLGYSLTQEEELLRPLSLSLSLSPPPPPLPPLVVPCNKTFGILELEVDVFHQVRKHLEIVIQQDISGSMSDRCRDGRTKMQHTSFTLERILDYMVENKIEVSIGLFAFDNVVEERIPLQVLNSSNLHEMSMELNRLKPRNGTNIGKALDKEHVPPKDPASDRLFILLTDGQANDGVTDKEALKRKVDKILSEDTNVVTVGCGTDHDSKLLDFINPGNYYFVDDFEKSGLVCGEFLDKQLNTLLKQVVITVENGEIFSWRENVWVTSLLVGPVVAECNRTYHVRATNPAEFTVRVTAVSIRDNSPFACEVVDKEFEQDLTKFKFRQETLELLSEVRLYNETTYYSERSGSNAKRIKKSLLNLFKRMKEHMDKNNLRESDCEDGRFMRVLCDDIVVAHRTFGDVALSAMYINARQTSQGEQRTYTVSQEEPAANKRNKVQFQDDEDDLLPLRPPSMSRQYTVHMKQMEEDEEEDENLPCPPPLTRMNHRLYRQCAADADDDDDEFSMPSDIQYCSMSLGGGGAAAAAGEDEEEILMSQHLMTDCMTSPYANARQLTMMRGCSYTPPEEKDEDDDKK
jgi:hypothetical protein